MAFKRINKSLAEIQQINNQQSANIDIINSVISNNSNKIDQISGITSGFALDESVILLDKSLQVDGYVNGKGLTIINQSNTTISPKNNTIYIHTLNSNEQINIITADLSTNYCMTFELWLTMPDTLVSFTFSSATNIIWNSNNNFNSNNIIPPFNQTNTLYNICFRFDGNNLLANLAYTKNL